MRQRVAEPKRKREINFQGWYDPEDAYEQNVINAFIQPQTKHSATPKQVIAEAVLRLAADEHFVPTSIAAHEPMDDRYEQLTGLLNRLMQMIETGGFVAANDHARQAFESDAQEFDAISRSVGSRYRPMSFDEDEE